MPHIVLAGRTFELNETPPKSGMFLAVAAAERSRDELRLMSLYYKLIRRLVSDEVSDDELDDALSEMEMDEVNKALVAATETFEKAQEDPTSPVASTSGRSSPGSDSDEGTSRVVSFSKAAS